jgi:hypothetical protein
MKLIDHLGIEETPELIAAVKKWHVEEDTRPYFVYCSWGGYYDANSNCNFGNSTSDELKTTYEDSLSYEDGYDVRSFKLDSVGVPVEIFPKIKIEVII